MVGLYSSIQHRNSLEALREALDKSKLVKVVESVLKTNYFHFLDKEYQRISGTAIDTTFAPYYTCIVIDRVESSYKLKSFKASVSSNVDNIFYIWTRG